MECFCIGCSHGEQGVPLRVARIELRDFLRWRLKRGMNRIEGKVSEEWLIALTPNEGGGLFAEPIREVSRFCDHLGSPIDRIIGVIELEVVMRSTPEKAKNLIKPT